LPEEEVVSVTSLSDQALNYIPSIMHKFLVLGEAVHNEIIEHQIRDMLSRKELSRYVVMKNPKSGELCTVQMKTPTVVSCVMSTTRQNINQENLSRFFLVNADETREQTKKIHEAQRRKYTLKRYEEKSLLFPGIMNKHHAAQRLLKKVLVVNEFAERLDFPDTFMRTRRDHDRFMDLIAAVCFLRQYQKEKNYANGTEYIECDLEDYRIAYEIMVKGVLTVTLMELPKSAVELYEALRSMARKLATKDGIKVKEKTFTQREIREQAGYGHTWIKNNLRLLVEYEYIIMTRGGKERSRGVYRLRDDCDIESLNLAMIPVPEEMERKLKSGQSGQRWS
jgi:hypothetical protein